MKLSIIIPVYREEALICRTLGRIRELGLPLDLEIIISDGGPNASTLAHIRKRLPGSPDLILVESDQGRGIQMNRGAARARGDLLLFLHADTCPSSLGAASMVRRFIDWQKGNAPAGRQGFCGAFDLHIDSPKKVFRAIEKIASMRSRLTGIPYGDQGIFISRQFFRRLGGFPDYPIMEDVGLMEKVKAAKSRPIFLDHTISTSARRWEDQGLFFTTLRNWVLISLYFLGISPQRLARFYPKTEKSRTISVPRP